MVISLEQNSFIQLQLIWFTIYEPTNALESTQTVPPIEFENENAIIFTKLLSSTVLGSKLCWVQSILLLAKALFHTR